MSQKASALPGDLSDPGFTPGARHFPALFAELGSGDEAAAEAAARALFRAGPAAQEACTAALSGSSSPLRGRLVRLLGRFAQSTRDPALIAALLGLLGDEDPKARRNAIIALGKTGGAGVEAALLEIWTKATLPERRSLAESLGKIGGTAARELLSAFASEDAELERLRRRALVMLERSASRSERSEEAVIVADVPLPAAVTLLLYCRAGLAPILLGEAQERGLPAPKLQSPSEVSLVWRASLAPLLELRTALDLGVAVPLATGSDTRTRVVETLLGPLVQQVLGAWTRGTPRFRLAWAGGGHRRADTWRIAEELSAKKSPLSNDPSGAAWEILVDEAGARLVLIPRARPDDRFAYRIRDVAAASHPTVAAALARVAGARPNDVVLDPFVGSGLELVERARLGPFHRLVGCDVDARALDAARANLRAAGLRAKLEQADARIFDPGPVTLIITNPPMGRRVARDGTLAPLLDAFIDHAAALLAKGGRLVWLSPFGARTARRLGQRGMSVERRGSVDLGGFEAELQVAVMAPKPATAPERHSARR